MHVGSSNTINLPVAEFVTLLAGWAESKCRCAIPAKLALFSISVF